MKLHLNLNLFLYIFFAATVSSEVGWSKPEIFEIKPFVSDSSSSQEIEVGLRQLYAPHTKDLSDFQSTIQNQINRTEEFQKFVRETLNQTITTQPKMTAEVTERRLTGNFVKETTIRFKSLIQRPGEHASNTVVARMYMPANYPAFCNYKFPTSIFLHHILNEVETIENVAKLIASGVIGQSAVVVVIHMPHYGERRQGNEEFLTADWNTFRLNMAQLILDVHTLKNFLDQQPLIDSTQFTLSGISLGAVMGLTVGAFDQSFSGYGFLVGGGDMASILFNRAKNRPDSEVAQALKKSNSEVDLSEVKIKNEIAALDPVTWMHRYKNKRLFMLNATQDDIVNYDVSVKPLVSGFEPSNKLKHVVNDDKHTPTGNALKKYTQVFSPLVSFLVNGQPRLETVCSSLNN